MCMRLEEEFGVGKDRALRITTLVRLLRGEGYEDVFVLPPESSPIQPASFAEKVMKMCLVNTVASP